MSEEPDELRRQLEQFSTEELTSILRNCDTDEWRPEAFEEVKAILAARGVSPEAVAALGPQGFDVVEGEPTVTLATYFSPPEAQATKLALEQAGIPAWVADEAGGTMYGIGIGARLQVRRPDVDRAREVLASAAESDAALPPDLAEPPCPACGSQNVTPEVRFDEAPPGALSISGSRRQWYYVCGKCGETWPL